MTNELATHFTALIPGILAGRVIPLLGAGVNLTGRSANTNWKPNCGFLPSGNELFEYLATKYKYPSVFDFDLAKLTQYVLLFAGERVLFDELNNVFDNNYTPSFVHKFFATLPTLLREKKSNSSQIIITTNYDCMMERAFEEINEPFDIISYITNGPKKGKFLHKPYNAKPKVLEKIKQYPKLDFENRSIIIKIHGSIKRYIDYKESYVITLDDYLEYLMISNITLLLPADLVEKLYNSHFLFLGYGLRDLNLQVILHRIWGEQELATKSWAVQIKPDEVDKVLWKKREVDIIDADVKEYIINLESSIKLALNNDR